MSGAITSELLKLRTTRTFLGIVIATLGLVALIAGASAAAAPWEVQDRPGVDLLDVAGIAQPFALILGVLAVSTEFRHGTITPTVLAVPDRARLIVAKLMAHGLAGVVLGIVSYGLATLLLLTILPVRDISAELPLGDGIKMAVGGIAGVALLAALGVGIGTVIRNQVGAVIGVLAWLFMIEPLLTAIPRVGPWVEDYGVGATMSAVGDSTTNSGDQLTQLTGGLVLLGYVALFAVAGIALLRQRDISA